MMKDYYQILGIKRDSND